MVDARDDAALGDDHAVEDIGQLILLSGCVTNQLKDSGLVDSGTISGLCGIVSLLQLPVETVHCNLKARNLLHRPRYLTFR